jgi:nucleoside-diphosphate-sugar epimerase
MDKGRVLVTGAGGFVMSSVVGALLEAEYRVIAVDHAFDSSLVAAWDNKPVEIIKTDAMNLPDVQADFLVHGTAITSSPDERGETPEANLRANLLPLLAVSEWAAHQNVQRWIFISSAAVD